MCGRYVLDTSTEQLVSHFGLEQPPNLTARYNIASSQLITVVAPKADPTKRGLAILKWGLVPDWSNDGKPGPINAHGLMCGAVSINGRHTLVTHVRFATICFGVSDRIAAGLSKNRRIAASPLHQ